MWSREIGYKVVLLLCLPHFVYLCPTAPTSIFSFSAPFTPAPSGLFLVDFTLRRAESTPKDDFPLGHLGFFSPPGQHHRNFFSSVSVDTDSGCELSPDSEVKTGHRLQLHTKPNVLSELFAPVSSMIFKVPKGEMQKCPDLHVRSCQSFPHQIPRHGHLVKQVSSDFFSKCQPAAS